MRRRHLVREFSGTWRAGRPVDRGVADKFEDCIEEMEGDGYRLHSWKFSATLEADTAEVDTVVAVFEMSTALLAEAIKQREDEERKR